MLSEAVAERKKEDSFVGRTAVLVPTRPTAVRAKVQLDRPECADL